MRNHFLFNLQLSLWHHASMVVSKWSNKQTSCMLSHLCDTFVSEFACDLAFLSGNHWTNITVQPYGTACATANPLIPARKMVSALHGEIPRYKDAGFYFAGESLVASGKRPRTLA